MKKKIFRVGGIVLISVLAFTFATRDLLLEHFPVLGDMLQASFGITTKNQESSLLARQSKTLQESDIAFVEAEKALIAAQTPDEKIVLNSSTVWQLSTGDDIPQPAIPLHEKVKVYGVVRVNPHPEHLPNEGEQTVLPMLNGESIKANVESVQTTENGDYIWSGHLDGYHNDYPIVMTYGEKLTFATVTTPEGSYSMEAINGVGWLYKNPSVTELSKPGGDDSIEILLQ